ncbi:MAG: TOBE domain-containing protein [Acidimicrobiales bacterium]
MACSTRWPRPREVYDRPADIVVAELLGSPAMNFVPMSVMVVAAAGQDRGLCLCAEGISLSLPLRVPAPPAEVIVGIRPEYLHLGEDLPAGRTVQGVVRRVELLGSERVVQVIVGDTTLALRVASSVRLQPGETVPVGFDPAGIRLFDPATGRALPLRPVQ